ncbi:MAG: plasma-membrane proton-efflux P-type ATPase [Smithella sp.]
MNLKIRNTSDYDKISLKETFKYLETTADGLSDAEVKKRLEMFGYNQIEEKKDNPLLQFLLRYWGPMPWLLELTMILSYALGHILEAVIIFILLSINAVIGYWNEHNSRKALDLLKKKLSVQTNIRRNGEWTKKSAAEVVPGDIVGIGLGDIVTADLKIINGEVSIDQSALTGESLPKALSVPALAYSGSIVKRGEAQGVVLNTGSNTYFGRTAKLVKTSKAASHQEQIIMKVIQYMLYVAFGAILLMVLDALILKTDLITILTISLILLLGAVPVALPAVFTVVLATGALELSRNSVLVTKLSAIEDAASMTILCLDKTGTITQNKLTVMDPFPSEGYRPEDVITAADMATDDQSRDVIDVAVKEYARSTGIRQDYHRQSFIPFEPAGKRTEAVVEDNGKQYRAVKGAAQVIQALCPGLDAGTKKVINDRVEALSRKGWRVLGVARSEGSDMSDLHFLGLLPLEDPPRKDSRAMIEGMKQLGIKVKMLTGDNLAIAREIARQVSVGNKIIRMPELKNLNETEQIAALEQNDGVAEIYPEDKHHIIKLLQSRGYIVGMTGDGVNDAPALKQAEVGIAVSSATDVAKAAASIVLTKPGLEAIAIAIKNSRRIYQRMLSWVLNKVTKVVQFVGLLIAGFLIWHQVLINALGMVLLVFANDFITMSLATDNAASTSGPNVWNVRKITLSSLMLGLLLVVQGLSTAAAGYYWFHLPTSQLQSLVLLSLVFTSLFKIFIIRERRHFWSSLPGKALLAAGISTLAVFFLLGVFGLIISPVPLYQVTVIFLYSAIFVFLLDIPKFYIFRKYGLG